MATGSVFPTDRLYRGTDVTARSAEDGREHLVNILERTGGIFPGRTAALLARCEGFRSLEEHADRICRASGLPSERAPAVAARLHQLAQAGLLTRHDQLLRRCRAQPAEPPGEPIAFVGVPSRDRPAALERALRSYMRNARDHGRDTEFVVMDDSREPSSRTAYRSLLNGLRWELGVRVAYADASEREAYSADLAREAGLPVADVRAALLNSEGFAVSTGSCRNALLLQATGRRFVHVDDDTICRVAAAPGRTEGVALAGVHAGMEMRVFATGEEARESVVFEDVDYLGLYESVLGQSVAEFLASREDRIDLDRIRPEFVLRLERRPAPIVLASLGVVGDSGLGSTEMYFFTAHPVSRAALLGFPGGHRAAFESHEVVRSTARTTVAETGLCLGIALGIDHRQILPPFTPFLRNSDGIFAAARFACAPESAVAFLPWVVEHSPVTTRRSAFDRVIQGAASARVADFLSWFIKDFAPGEIDEPRQRLAALSRHLVEIGGLSPGDYQARCRDVLRRRFEGMRRYVEVFESSCPPAPSSWRDDLEAYLAIGRATVESAEGLLPRDLLRDGVPAEEAAARGQRAVAVYGRLLGQWPLMVEAADALARRGRRPAPPLR